MKNKEMIENLEEKGKYQVLKLFEKLPLQFNDPKKEAELFTLCVIDVETTGLNANTCEIIDLAMRKVRFDKEGNLYEVLESFQGFNEPSIPLSEEVKSVTGYTDEMLKGKSLNISLIEEYMKDVDLVIAYNSAFDRKVVERYSDAFKNVRWGCAMKEVNWMQDFGVQGKLEMLAWKISKMFYYAHQALSDVDYTIQLLSERSSKTEKTVLLSILEEVRKPLYKIRAVGAPFDMKEELKDRGYFWDPGTPDRVKAWSILTNESNYSGELEYLKSNGVLNPSCLKVTSKDRYSLRA